MVWLLMLVSGIVQLQNVQSYTHYFIRPVEFGAIPVNTAGHQHLARKARHNVFGDGRSNNDNERITFPNDDNDDGDLHNSGIRVQNTGRGSWNNIQMFQNVNQNPRNRAQWFQNGGRGNEWLQNGRGHFELQNDRDFLLTTTTPNPRATTIVLPGSATKRSTCEDQCRATTQYDPICGTNSVTYTNIEWYKCALKCGKRVGIKAYRACPRF